LAGNRSAGIALLILAVAGCAWFLAQHNSPKPPVPVPDDMARLEPQLRAYLEEKVRWTQNRPGDWQRQSTLGIVYGANGLWPQARSAFSNAAVLNPREPLARLYFGISELELGNLEPALQHFKVVTNLFPQFAPGYYRLGEASLRAGATEQAVAAFERLIQLAPDEWQGYSGLADARIRSSRPSEAIQPLERAIALNPSAKTAHHLLGVAFRATGRLDDARRELVLGADAISYPMADDWFKLAPQHMMLLQDQIDAANEYSANGQPDRAARLLERALGFQPDNLSLRNHLAIAYNQAGHPEKARTLLIDVIRKDEGNLPATIALSYACVAMGLNDEALARAKRAIELGPNVAQAHLAMANVLLATERDAEALESLKSASRCDPANFAVYLEMGDVLWRNLKQPGEALTQYQKAVGLSPTSTAALGKLAELLTEQGKTNEAATVVESLKKLPDGAAEIARLQSEANAKP
jgi:tetratricopeptide (TPR) repeat protein